jgi:hypothetical protein
VIVPGFSFAISTRLLTSFAGTLGLAAKTSGVEPTKPIVVKSFTLS